MDFQQLIDSITPEIYENLKNAVETGRWPNGLPLTSEQREQSLQVIIAFDLRHRQKPDRVGYIHSEKHDHCGSTGSEPLIPEDEPKPIRWED